MKLLVQRVSQASVTVDKETVGAIGRGLMVLVCADPGDSDEDLAFLARKLTALRIFSDDAGKMNLSVRDMGGSILAVSQFTLAARWRQGNRPGFSDAAPPDEGRDLFDRFVTLLRHDGMPVETGVFGADMQVSLINDGPVTLWLDGRDPR
ncbi:D-tyrosyl-tRNA(Tyr) deacylase [Rhodospirillaceae bacterium KN72]|uniref:D-aminoacyl-tRNA deacylase n=1 Tax=Pacificispira spongiicola TaxID=2729598 RepID=A0A7Y0E0X1_9PROT|nr:D-aminoacyl-tRNA deacylase [Pacificispira spongiicola]NMM44431.1 D-tyrosyl-tRNA(Tyr) deacylase [Pacificispira spongiicola]